MEIARVGLHDSAAPISPLSDMYDLRETILWSLSEVDSWTTQGVSAWLLEIRRLQTTYFGLRAAWEVVLLIQPLLEQVSNFCFQIDYVPVQGVLLQKTVRINLGVVDLSV